MSKRAEEQRAYTAKRDAVETLCGIDEGRLIQDAAGMVKVSEIDVNDVEEFWAMTQTVRSEANEVKAVLEILGSKVCRKYTAAKLREMADLVDMI